MFNGIFFLKKEPFSFQTELRRKIKEPELPGFKNKSF